MSNGGARFADEVSFFYLQITDLEVSITDVAFSCFPRRLTEFRTYLQDWSEATKNFFFRFFEAQNELEILSLSAPLVGFAVSKDELVLRGKLMIYILRTCQKLREFTFNGNFTMSSGESEFLDLITNIRVLKLENLLFESDHPLPSTNLALTTLRVGDSSGNSWNLTQHIRQHSPKMQHLMIGCDRDKASPLKIIFENMVRVRGDVRIYS